jgi:methyltransferase (TIGR00027 family)
VRDGGSRTAQHVALFRALETARPRARLFHDPYARAFLPARYRWVAALARVPALGHGFERYIDARWPGGPRASAVVRTRLIDDLVTEALADGCRQVLLLGAGYDSRAYRLAAMRSVPVFEVDHPATQATKRRLLSGQPASQRQAAVRFVPVDLIHDDLPVALSSAGFSTVDRTVVVWEGVTNYLTESAVDTTLRGLATAARPGSRIILTYVDRSALDGTGHFAGADDWHAAVRRQGEPWTFGFHPAQLPRYLEQRGMVLRSDVSAREAAARYLAPLRRDEPTAAFYRIADVEIG